MLWKERGRNGRATAFQADDEGSIPFTRSNHLASVRGVGFAVGFAVYVLRLASLMLRDSVDLEETKQR